MDRNTEAIAALRKFVVENPLLRELEKQLDRFNLFDVLRSTHSEIRHSNILAWLLTPDGSHGLDDQFLRRWLMRVFHEAKREEMPIDPVELDSVPIRSVGIRREWEHIDLLIEVTTDSGQWLICIENKINATESEGQLKRYKQLVDLTYPNARRAFIFLTTDGAEPSNEAYSVATYGQVLATIRECIAENESAVGPGPRLLMENYAAVIAERFMEDSEVARLARQIYAAHRAAIDTIIEHKPDALREVTETLQGMMEKDAAALRIQPIKGTKGFVRWVPQEWWNHVPVRWGPEWAHVYCELNLWKPQVCLNAILGPDADPNWRGGVYTIATQRGYPNTTRRKSLPEKWYTFLVLRSDLAVEVPDDSTATDLARQIWDWCKSEMAGQTYRGMVADIAQHVSQL